ncbi:MAG TPA: 2,3-bisphosphoglycerate-independent phosphoglycerate mutase [Candidatus Methylomirabilis sp.]|nr:2,3-bisphosphoglycerate-independent phosphoglycerate mutase [Candidatus Methylomirabilis sp.]
MPRPKPVILVVIDGFGVAPSIDGNAVREARMPVMQRLIESYPAMTVQSSGMAVGLSWGEMGNSEVGHITIGAGRVFYQSLPRVNVAIENGEFFNNPVFVKAAEHVRKSGGTLHLMGLVSQGGVHAQQEHLYALLDFCNRQKITNVAVQAFLDGRDTIYNSALGFVEELEAKMKELKVGKIATLSGRYWAMDRDNRWDRVQKAYDAIALGTSEQTFETARDAIQASYAKNVFDEEFVPSVIMKDGKPVATVKDGDVVIFFNFRPDRARQLAKAFVLPTFDKFSRTKVSNLLFATLMEYEKDLPVEVAYPPQIVETCLARVLSDAGLKQLHIAETEKYAHVTFFMNGMREAEFPGEDRVIIPSPPVSSYDKAPEMSALSVAERVVKEIAEAKYDAIILNFANPDMVGHTGNEPATVAGCEAVDKALGRIVDAALAVGGVILITADHGNAEEVKNLTTGEIDKEHSTNPVPFLIVGKQFEGMKAPVGDIIGGDLSMTQPVGMLADVAPTMLKIMELQQPDDMTGRSLI